MSICANTYSAQLPLITFSAFSTPTPCSDPICLFFMQLSSAVDASHPHPRLPPPPRSLPTHLGRVSAPLIMSFLTPLLHAFLTTSSYTYEAHSSCSAYHAAMHNHTPLPTTSPLTASFLHACCHTPQSTFPRAPPQSTFPRAPPATFLSRLLPSPAYLQPIARDATDVWVWHMHAEAENTFQYPTNAWTLPQPDPQRLVRVAEGSGWAYMVEGQRYGFEEKKEPWPRFGYRPPAVEFTVDDTVATGQRVLRARSHS
ncbi:unnamed protein product [Closterium sp. Naga37s-1]|nr:unnamed protein product [Closterium sp. Naga37s-1]